MDGRPFNLAPSEYFPSDVSGFPGDIATISCLSIAHGQSTWECIWS